MKTKLTLFVTVLAAALFGVGCASTEPAFVSDGLVAYYPFNGNAKDESGNGNHGEVKGATLELDRNGDHHKAFSFNGSADFIEIKDSESLRPQNITITAWVKTNKQGTVLCKNNRSDASAEQYALAVGEGGKSAILHIKRNSNGIAGRGWQRAFSNTSFNENIKEKGWVMLSSTWNGEEQVVYLNGAKVGGNAEAPHGGIDNIAGGTLSIGRNRDGDKRSFTGSIDDVRIYNRALSAEEVKALCDLEKPKEK